MQTKHSYSHIKKYSQRGFSLVELMVVLVILGILSTVAVVSLSGTTGKAKATEVLNVVSRWETAQQLFALETGYMGTTEEIGFVIPESKYFTITVTDTEIVATAKADLTGDCKEGGILKSTGSLSGGEVVFEHGGDVGCKRLLPSF
jgi:prepilin-type N-terminal cleavage/methylation domain-containing protein